MTSAGQTHWDGWHRKDTSMNRQKTTEQLTMQSWIPEEFEEMTVGTRTQVQTGLKYYLGKMQYKTI